MKDILARPGLQALARLASSNPLLAFDYDGTLAPIVAHPKQARMRESTRGLLERVARAYPCIVISGRSQEDALRRVRGTGVLLVFGNHGLEPWRRTEPFAAPVQAWLPSLRRALASVDGVFIEDKLFSLAIHYRRARSRKKARSAILRAVSHLDDARILGGKCVVNLIPRRAPHKGTALEQARAQLGCDVALYVGDDETDEDVFTLDHSGRLLTVRVGPKATSRAAFYIRDQRDIDRLLSRLLEFRHSRARRLISMPARARPIRSLGHRAIHANRRPIRQLTRDAAAPGLSGRRARPSPAGARRGPA